jgi:hypothetical protein
MRPMKSVIFKDICKMAKDLLLCVVLTRTHLKNVFWPNIFVGASFQILDIQTVCLRFETRRRRDLEPKSYF